VDIIDLLAAWLNSNVIGSDEKTSQINPSMVVTKNCTPVTVLLRSGVLEVDSDSTHTPSCFSSPEKDAVARRLL